MEIETETISKYFHSLAKRPGMYVDEITFDKVTTHLGGFFLGLRVATCTNIYEAWRYWLSMKFEIWNTAWSWSRTIRHQVETDDEAIACLPILFDEFAIEYNLIGHEGIEEKHNNYDFKNELPEF